MSQRLVPFEKSRLAAAFAGFCLLIGMSSSQAAGGLRDMAPARQAPPFELPDLSGQMRKLSDYRGRYVFVNFWAVWCGPCRKEMPSMERTYQKLKGEDFEMLAIHVGPSSKGAEKFRDQLGLTYPILMDERMALTSWEVRGLPTTYILDPEGNIIAEAVGDRDWDDEALLTRLKALIKKN